MRCVLVYSYFCPSTRYRAGGVQQVVQPLLDALERSHGWSVGIIHSGVCESQAQHHLLADFVDQDQPDCIRPERLIAAARHVNQIALDFDVVLSVDRALPRPPSKPSVLMSNTLCYQTEVWAVLTGPWNRVIAPTRYFRARLKAVAPALKVSVVPYGLSPSTLHRLTSMPQPPRSAPPYIVRMPHRPDRRKGHVAAIEGLSRAMPAARDAVLEIAWLDEERYVPYRSELEQLAKLHGVCDQVAFTPWLDGDARWMAAVRGCATLLVGDFEESFGLAAIESVVSGRPVITCGQPAVSEVLGDTELHLRIDDARDWYEQLKLFWGRAEDASESRLCSPALADSLTLDRMAASYHDILTDVVSGR